MLGMDVEVDSCHARLGCLEFSAISPYDIGSAQGDPSY